MLNKKHVLIWIDLEMTGLDVDRDAIIEIATVITDTDLHVIEEGPVCVILQPEDRLSAMDKWNTKHHSESGLLDRVRKSKMSVAEAEQQTLDFVRKHVPANHSPMCGSSICQDRRFLHRCMPKLERHFHYRNLDVTTLKMLTWYWAPQISKKFKKRNAHLALQDVYESIEELRHYRAHCFKSSLSQAER